jgi:two-component system, chemotaxis family, response regulator Rcp1
MVIDRPSVRILLVEDNESFRTLIRRLLEHRVGPRKWDVSEASDGETALALMSGDLGVAEPLKPDIILLDWNLPGIGGEDVLLALKRHTELRMIPVLVLSASTDAIDVNRAYFLHANGYIAKPSKVDVLEKVVNAIEAFWVSTVELSPA